ncbi:MAG: carbohydrate porin [Gammaproteobacteria bacterium]|nr:carbohydrate porin [Gammaproteobacteria bacterium]
MQYRKTQLALSLSGALLISSMLDVISPAMAQVDIPNRSDRRPNLSLDPFERAREAMKNLPNTSQPSRTEPEPEPVRERAQPEEPRSSIAPAPVVEAPALAPTKASEPEEPAEAFSYGLMAVADYFSLASGGLNQAADPNEAVKSGSALLLDISGEIDTEAAGYWKNGLFSAQFVVYGTVSATSPGDIVGDFHGLSGNDAGPDPLYKIYEGWYQHSFDHGKASIRVGIQDWNSEFYISEFANLYMNGTPGMGGVVNMAGPSTFPATSLGFRFLSELTENSYYQISVFDATPDEGGIVAVNLSNDDGFFSSMELGMSNAEPGEEGYYRIGGGMWFLRTLISGYVGTSEEDELIPPSGDPVAVNTGSFDPQSGTYGAYVFGEMAIGDRIGVFVKAGWADPRYNRYSLYGAAGVNYSGLVPGRVDDVLGIAVNHTQQSKQFLSDNWDNDNDVQSSFTYETNIELTYSAQINDWLMIQPDFQYIMQPAMQYGITNAAVVGIRVQAEY